MGSANGFYQAVQPPIAMCPHIRPPNTADNHSSVGQVGANACSSDEVGKVELTAVGDVATGGVMKWTLGPVADREEADGHGDFVEDSDVEARRPKMPREPGNQQRKSEKNTHVHIGQHDHGASIAWPERELRVRTGQQRQKSKS